MSRRYRVCVDDNFHYMDDDERYIDGEFDDCESARKRCMEIVDVYLKNAYKDGMTFDQLLDSYESFGEDPWISSTDDCKFSAWNYAEQRCKEICKTKRSSLRLFLAGMLGKLHHKPRN
ncbi:MAG TPA: hypothetical protein VJZ75_10850 [Candidatus Bathyarchaeia archaeon]|nr:hypothetical protein [Candidatus Bathyarchaeia archaeon]